jgi:signal transduction histidine kinase
LDERAVLRTAVTQARRILGDGWIGILDLPRHGGRSRRFRAGIDQAQFAALALEAIATFERLANSTGQPLPSGYFPLSEGQVSGLVVAADSERLVLAVVELGCNANVLKQPELSAYFRLVGLAWRHARRHRSATDRVQRQVERLNLAAEVGATIGSVEGLERVLDRIVRQTAVVTGVKVSSVLLADEHRQGFYIAATHGIDSRGERIPRDKAATWQVMLTGRPFQVLDGQSDERFPALQAFARRAGTRACLSVPLVVRSKVIGSIDIHSSEVRHFSNQDVRLLQVVASQAAIAIENARLYDSIDHERRLLSTIVQGMWDGLILEDEHGQVLYANQVAGELLGLATERLQGVAIEQVYRRLARQTSEPERVEAQLISAVQRHAVGHLIDLSLCEPRPLALRIRIIAAKQDPGRPTWYLHLLHDLRWEQAADRAKSVLLSTVSHELRTPLTNIKGFVTSLLSPDVDWDASTRRDFLEEVNAEADHLTSLVDSLLNLSKLEAGVLEIRKRWEDLNALISHEVGQCARRVPAYRFETDLEPDLPPAFLDPARIREVLRNLLENAIKYSEPGSRIAVASRCSEGEFQLSVADEGSGIPPDALQHIFERFYRWAPRGRQISGTGLGLAISKGLVEAHGGRIWAESQVGQGTRVSFSLPLLGDDRILDSDELQDLSRQGDSEW